jgi:hypothetical protein
VELYPTIEVATAVPRTEAFLAHAPIPVEFTQEDLDQVLSGNFVTKVIYLPDPEFQELAVAGVGTLVSTRLDPGVDPITEASHRGAILAVVRIGNKDLQLSGGQPQAGAIAPASYQTPNGCNRSAAAPLPMGIQANATAGVPMSHVVGVTAPQYGSPSCATAVGLPGPPCLPLGAPAGLEKVVYRHCLACPIKPKPTEHVCVDVLNVPGGCVKGKCADKSCCKNGETVESDRVVGGTTQTMAPAATNMPTAAQNCNQQ